MLNFLNDQPTKQATDAERAFLGLIEAAARSLLVYMLSLKEILYLLKQSSHLWTEALFYAIRSEARL